MPNEPKIKTVICPECKKECTLTKDDDGIYQGKCQNEECGLDVGWVYEKRRRDKAVKSLEDDEVREEEKEDDKNKKKNKGKGFRLPNW